MATLYIQLYTSEIISNPLKHVHKLNILCCYIPYFQPLNNKPCIIYMFVFIDTFAYFFMHRIEKRCVTNVYVLWLH